MNDNWHLGHLAEQNDPFICALSFVCYEAIRDWKDFVVAMWLDGNLSCICAAYFQNWMLEKLIFNRRIFWFKNEVLSQESCLLSLLDTNQFLKDEVKMKWLVDVQALMSCLHS